MQFLLLPRMLLQPRKVATQVWPARRQQLGLSCSLHVLLQEPLVIQACCVLVW
jgi:hypothetical protein